MNRKNSLLLSIGFIVGVITHTVKSQVYKNLLDKCTLTDDSIIIHKGFLRNKVVEVDYENISSLKVSTGMRYRFLSQMKIDIILTNPSRGHITIVTNYSTANKLREKVEHQWKEETDDE
jgi:uncharacterized membrane protein YdbT with pleckstrin-like domain